MAPRKTTAGERATIGFVIVLASALFWISGERRIVAFILLAIFLPYLAVVAPFKCGGYRVRDGVPCTNNGYGLLVGCNWHRLDRLRRVFAGTPTARRRLLAPDPPRATGRTPSTTAMIAEPSRLRAVDMISLAVSILGTLAGWLAVIGPFNM